MVCKLNPHIRLSAVTMEPAWDNLCLPLYPSPHALLLSLSLPLFLSKMEINTERKRVEINTQRDSVPMKDKNEISLRMKWLVQLLASCVRNKKHIWARAKGNLHCLQWEPSWQDACILTWERERKPWSSLFFLPILWVDRGSSDSSVGGLSSSV